MMMMVTKTTLNILTPQWPMMIQPINKAITITIQMCLRMTENPITMTLQADSQSTSMETKFISIIGILLQMLMNLMPIITKVITMFIPLTLTLMTMMMMKCLPQSRLPILLLTTMTMI